MSSVRESLLAKTNPILIIDEPQSVLGTDKSNATRKGIKLFNPLFTLLYSATHREIFNQVYRLDAIDAYNKKLVKKIEVRSVHQVGSTATNGYVYLDEIVISKGNPQARLGFDVKTTSGTRQTIRLVNEGFDLKEQSGGLQEYADNWTQQAIIESNGGSMLKKENGKTLAGFDTPEAAEAYQLLADMVQEGTGLHATNEEGFQAYLSGKLGMVCTTIGKRANFEKSAKFEVMAAPFPKFEGKELKVPAGGNFLMLFSKDDAKKQAAIEFIKYLESPEALLKWSTGTGYLPPRKGVENDPNGFKKLVDTNKNVQVALSLMPNLVPWASFPGANGLQAEQLLIDARDIILSGKESAAQALHETAEKINSLM